MEKNEHWYPGKDHENDPHHGVGGTYLVDKDGKRQLVEGSRTGPAAPATENTEAKE